MLKAMAILLKGRRKVLFNSIRGFFSGGNRGAHFRIETTAPAYGVTTASLTLPTKPLLCCSYRFKIETMFSALKHQLGAFCYHFWTKSLPKLVRRRSLDYSALTQTQRVRCGQAIEAVERFVNLGCRSGSSALPRSHEANPNLAELPGLAPNLPVGYPVGTSGSKCPAGGIFPPRKSSSLPNFEADSRQAPRTTTGDGRMMISCNPKIYHCRGTKDNEDLMLHGKTSLPQ